jgi:hypothetical protein
MGKWRGQTFDRAAPNFLLTLLASGNFHAAFPGHLSELREGNIDYQDTYEGFSGW